MKRLVIVLLLLISVPLAASHIVGGEIELLHLQGITYRVNLIYYFDFAHNSNRNIQAEEPNIEMFIFRKSDNRQLRSVIANWLRKTRVGYTQPSCSQGEIITDKIIYTTTIQLPAAEYSDPAGYYITWARCCRNYSILNIISQDPDRVGAEGAGQTFYLEFPPVTMNGQPFVNSSPKDFPALNDYACPTKPYYVDFAGTDDDGDSLAYSLTTPLSTSAVVPVPDPSPAPYPLVNWLNGFGLDKIINGNPKAAAFPDLSINIDGFLRVTPRSQGLYVFAVKVEEYRNKIKIGEVRRDFQMLVTDCRVSVPPKITGKKVNAPSFVANTISVQYANTVADNDRCIVVRISDEDSNRAIDNFEEVITLRLVAMNFKSKNINSLLPAQSTGVIHNNGTIDFTICLPECPFTNGGAYRIGVIAFDDACALPLSDTLKVDVDVEPPHNERAKFVNDLENVTVNEGGSANRLFEARDAEGDDLLFFALTDGFSLERSGMKTNVTSNVSGSGVLKGEFTWDAFCDIYDFTKRTNFTLKLLVDDADVCDLNDPDTATFNLTVLLPPDTKPIVDTNLTSDPEEIEIAGVEKKIFDSWSFNVTGQDIPDNDLVTVQMKGDGFNPSDYGMSFAKKSAFGSVSSQFQWDLACDKFNLDVRDEFNIGFIAVDSTGKCRVRQVDSLVVKVKVLKPLNGIPRLSITNLGGGVEFDNGNALIRSGQTMNLQFDVADDDAPKDNLTLQLIDMGGDAIPQGWTFDDVTGVSVLTSTFSWAPLCSIFEDAVYERDFYFDFRYTDDHCLTAVADTVRVNVKVKDLESGNFDILPANVFTPNSDGFNDYYSMERRDASGDLVNILPPDNCRGVFEAVKIYNRWGRPVFTSSDRNFRWYGLEESAGVYFYHVIFSNREFKGTVSLRD